MEPSQKGIGLLLIKHADSHILAQYRFLMMCLVGDKRPPIEWPRFHHDDRPQVMRVYQLPFVPLGLVSKLMTRMLYFMRPLVYWKEGMVAETDVCEILLEFQSIKNQIKAS
jgi:hypothetical protein